MAVEGQTLCSQCQEIDLSPVLFRDAYPDYWLDGFLDDSRSSFELGPLRSMFHRARSCEACKIFCETLEEFMDAEDLTEKLSHQRRYHCYLGWHEYIRAIDKADLPRYRRPVEALYRLKIGLWYRDEDGDKMWYSAPNLMNLFQPALWPIPQLKSAEGHSIFWDTLRSGRLRSTICEGEVLRTWLHKCESSHSMCWWTGPKTSFRLRLFDVRFRCVRQFQIAMDNTVKYVALSYVWGSQAQHLTLTRANQNVLSKQGAIKLDDLSRTISDAAVVVEMLGERYLWVDALCIIQDDHDDLAAQIPIMGQTYARSLATIVAAASIDANSGLPGVSTQARSIQRILGPLKGGVLLETCVSKPVKKSKDAQWSIRSHYLDNSKWDTRGWTFQEKVLSRRCLFFMEEQVYWECQCASWCEETCIETSDSRFAWEAGNPGFVSTEQFPAGQKMEGDGVTWAFSALIEEYTSRTLTFQRDTYRAFSGLVQILEDFTGATIFKGIHESEFGRSLLWHNEEASVLRSGEDFPTWSWLAWTGRISLTSQGYQNHFPQITCYRASSDNSPSEVQLVPVLQKLRPNFRSETINMHELAINIRSQLKKDFHIVFWADLALLDVPHAGESNLYHINPELNPAKEGYGQIGFVYPGGRRGDRNDRTGTQEFILIREEPYNDFQDHENPGSVGLLMISWHNGIARRECVASFDAREWTRAKPQRKLIVMG